MNLYRLELKRVCKTRMTAILLVIALVLAVVMAYLPVTFIGWTELDASGNKVSYTGLPDSRNSESAGQPSCWGFYQHGRGRHTSRFVPPGFQNAPQPAGW